MNKNISLKVLFVMCSAFVLITTMGLSLYTGKLFVEEVDDLSAKNTFQTLLSDIASVANSYIFVSQYLSKEQNNARILELESKGIVAIYLNNGSLLWKRNTSDVDELNSIDKGDTVITKRFPQRYLASIPLIIDAELSSLQAYAVNTFSDLNTDPVDNELLGHAVVEKPFISTLGRDLRNRYLIIGGLIISSMIALLTIIIYRMIGKPLTLLKSRIASGELDEIENGIRLETFSTEEIVSLSSVYLNQHRKITQANETLEEQVKSRTEELNDLTERLRVLAFRVDHDNQSITNRMAAEIHDDLCSIQISLKRRMERFLIRQPFDSTALNNEVRAWIELTDRADMVARSIIDRTQTRVANILGLAAGIEDAMRHAIENEEGIDAYFINRSDNIDNLEPFVHIDLVKIVREAVRNVILHSKATRLTVSIDDEDGNAVVTISDNGKGFKRRKIRKSYGLQTMEQRALYINGNVEFKPSDNGTVVVVSVPYSTSLEYG